MSGADPKKPNENEFHFHYTPCGGYADCGYRATFPSNNL
jgi:hypothetical protein